MNAANSKFPLRMNYDKSALYADTFASFSLIIRYHRNTDKMSDEEKIPIAVAGLVGISLPFILGLIALYAARG
jgi:hypothetical protein